MSRSYIDPEVYIDERANVIVLHAGQLTRGTPGGRYRADGPHSGEAFREDNLVPALRRAAKGIVRVRLVEAEGWPSGWLEEAFGGLERHHSRLSDVTVLQLEGSAETCAEVERYMTEARAVRLSPSLASSEDES